MYERKVLLIKQLDKTYALKNKTLGGVATFLCNGKTVRINLNLVNVDFRKAENWSVAIDFGGVGFSYPFSQEKELPVAVVSQASLIIAADGFAAAFADTNGKPNAELIKKFTINGFSYGGKTDTNIKKEEIEMNASKIKTTAKKVDIDRQSADYDETPTKYERFILSSDNYYLSDYEEKVRDKEKIDTNSENGGKRFDGDVFKWKTNIGESERDDARKAVKKYAEVFEENAGKDGFYSAVKKEISILFDSFPVCIELTEKIKNSVWTKIDGKKGRYFALGLVLIEGLPKYICYALPAKQGMFSAKSAYLDAGTGYRIVAQDADTGKIAEKADFWR